MTTTTVQGAHQRAVALLTVHGFMFGAIAPNMNPCTVRRATAR